MNVHSTLEKYTHLQINLVFTGDSRESLVYDVLQLNVLHTGHLMFQLIRYSKYREYQKFTQADEFDLLGRPHSTVNSTHSTKIYCHRFCCALFCFCCKTRLILDKYTHLQINLVLRETRLEPS
ncbi:hypothetical protein CSKR_100807 [Clonorchis sinensis]|uniref:Uncharacterized protein n=1 Tax=Clonorchis sinensis TaxID=79923 RepID=A0A3R7DNS3_CLOSI|nr:hypothetical protein CSKR_100807 [Clonorchis sinensis]